MNRLFRSKQPVLVHAQYKIAKYQILALAVLIFTPLRPKWKLIVGYGGGEGA
jgi:hypothetical protein